MTPLGPLPVTTVGSWPRPRALLAAQKQVRAGRLEAAAFDALADEAVRDVLRLQIEAGVDLVTDGEQRRDNFFSFVATKLTGVDMLTLAEMLEIVEDKDGFERILRTLDVPAYAISNATCVGRVERKAPLAADDLAFVRRQTDRPVKVPLPGPYLLTRAMWVKEVAQATYPTKEDLGEDVVRVLRAEIGDLIAGGAAFVQLDEPVLTELVFTQGETRTFMCAALAARKDPAEELEFAVDLVNRVVEGFEDARIGLHVCRGNWSRDEKTLLRGGYGPLLPWFELMNVRQLVLEYATERAGDLLPIEGKELGLGVVNPRHERVESPAEIEKAVEAALRHYEPDALFLNPDCGFGTFANRPVNEGDIAVRKLESMAAAARSLRARLDGGTGDRDLL